MAARRGDRRRDRSAAFASANAAEIARGERGTASGDSGGLSTASGKAPETPATAPGGPPDARDAADVPFGVINWTLSIIGVLLLIYGFLLLGKANAQGDNTPALVSPFLIVGSYLMIFVAIILRAPSRAARGRDGGPS